jgi:uncharacterized protein (TIGR03435 family)
MANRRHPASHCASRLRILAIGIAGFAASALSQINPANPGSNVAGIAATPAPSIEVAAIKFHDPNSSYNNFRFARDRVALDNQPISRLIEFAYAINQEQIIDAPAWIRDSHFDIDGKTNAEADPTVPEQQKMILQLLADRFGLRVHRDKRELSVYALQIAKGGPRLAPAANANAQPLERSNGHGYETTKTFTSTAMSDFILVMQFFLDRPIVDQTGLQSRYDFQLSYNYGDAADTDPDAPPPLFTAIQEQLGLKFQPTKAASDVLVIDHIEQPSAN